MLDKWELVLATTNSFPALREFTHRNTGLWSFYQRLHMNSPLMYSMKSAEQYSRNGHSVQKTTGSSFTSICKQAGLDLPNMAATLTFDTATNEVPMFRHLWSGGTAVYNLTVHVGALLAYTNVEINITFPNYSATSITHISDTVG